MLVNAIAMGADQNHSWNAVAASAIDWWIDAGVDALLDEQPRNWLITVPPPNQPSERPAARAVADAPQVEPLPATLDSFLIWREGPAAPETAWPGAFVANQGPLNAPIMILVDVPEREDVDAGMLLSGATGRLFDHMLAAIGRDRGSVHIVAMCAKRPTTGRITPEMEERLVEVTRHYVALAGPKRVLLLGNAPSRALLGADVAPARGNIHSVNLNDGNKSVTVEAVASFHPRFLLDRPAQKADAWRDLKMLIGGLGT